MIESMGFSTKKDSCASGGPKFKKIVNYIFSPVYCASEKASMQYPTIGMKMVRTPNPIPLPYAFASARQETIIATALVGASMKRTNHKMLLLNKISHNTQIL